ncbi:hypothetical protein GUITHDRAFT_102799 [Guillardia theta CCMP2712]|uniref:Uncharacterized protein n=1 Tax=Guillardia theta (strain CCMP2712) TaxID=905079 RepID=L1JSJ7_GUITC|nr:hypothetical protein GUITHDRAFT_102799 [Guillardia theta CCMP2712]EKX51536.1 hypothetical protein GUITHDRAFT_102799 [Guillardia theta CCMP2712]|eukprot:XP_005838516.1 hypothetical protein GUITHDRAFT_102799 [Guillardia theta CCMP2712]
MPSFMEFVLKPVLLDQHLQGLKTDSKLKPDAHELLQSLVELAQNQESELQKATDPTIKAECKSSQAFAFNLAARVVLKAGLTLEDIEHGIPHAQQLTLLKHTHALEPENRILECDIHRWVLRSMLFRLSLEFNDDLKTLTDRFESEPNTTESLKSWDSAKDSSEQAALSIVKDHIDRCRVLPHRLAALALALRMLRLSTPDAPPTPFHGIRRGKAAARPEASEPAEDELENSKDVDMQMKGAAMTGSGLMILAAELLRLQNKSELLLDLLHLDNALRLSAQNAMSRAESSSSAENGFFAKLFAEGIEGISPLPWPYRQHLMCSIPDSQSSDEEEDQENIQLSFSAANCIAALTGASAASAYVGLRMRHDLMTVNQPYFQAEELSVSAESHKDQITRKKNIRAVIQAARRTMDVLVSAENQENCTEMINKTLPAKLQQNLKMGPILVNAFLAASEHGATKRARNMLEIAIDQLQMVLSETEEEGKAGDKRSRHGDGEEMQSDQNKAGPSSANKRKCRESFIAGLLYKRKEVFSDEQLKHSCFSAGEIGINVRESASKTWNDVEGKCRELGEMSLGIGRSPELSDEQIESLSTLLDGIVLAASEAGGHWISHEYPQQGWFDALSGMSTESLSAAYSLCRRLEGDSRVKGIFASSLEDVKSKKNPYADVRMLMLRAILMILQEREQSEAKWAIEGAKLALTGGNAKIAIRCLVMSALNLLGGDESGFRSSLIGTNRVPVLPKNLTELLIECLCKASCGADAIIVSQMQTESALRLYFKHCSELDMKHAMWLWNMDVMERLMQSLDAKNDQRRVGWVLEALSRPQLNCSNAETIRASFALQLMQQFLLYLLRQFS